MNEPSRVSSMVGIRKGIPCKSVIAMDRLGFRSVIGEGWAAEDQVRVAEVRNEMKSVVLVEDSDDDALLFDLALRRSGRKVWAQRAENGSQARQLLAGQRPSLIAMDCHLPGESGLELLREIRSMESYSRVPIVMMSGTESDADVEFAYAYGANSFLRKPVSCEDYIKSVDVLLEYWLDNNCTLLTPYTPNCVWAG